MRTSHKRIDLVGRRFGYLTVVKYIGYKKHGSYYLCLCDCGTQKEIRAAHLTGDKIKSCGCQHANLVSQNRRTHGQKHSSEYNIWCSMNQRCYDTNSHAYADYGGRGIRVCDQWRNSFEQFHADMGQRPGPGYSIDRIDNDGPYSPENCKWSTSKEQAHNRRSTINITFDGKTQTIQEWADEIGIAYTTLHNRLRILNLSVERALTAPLHARRKKSEL